LEFETPTKKIHKYIMTKANIVNIIINKILFFLYKVLIMPGSETTLHWLGRNLDDISFLRNTIMVCRGDNMGHNALKTYAIALSRLA